MIKLVTIGTVIIAAIIVVAVKCTGGSSEQASTPQPTQQAAPTTIAGATKEVQALQEQIQQLRQQVQQTEQKVQQQPQPRKNFWNYLRPDSSNSTYRYSPWSGRGVAERLGMPATEPQEPWPGEKSAPRGGVAQNAFQEGGTSGIPPRIDVIPRDQDTAVLVPKCPDQDEREETREPPQEEESPRYTEVSRFSRPHATTRPVDPHCGSHAYFSAADHLCHCYSGGVEDINGFCLFTHAQQNANHYRRIMSNEW